MTRLLDTLSICVRIVLARHFGRYIHSGWDGKMDYSLYIWRGREVYVQRYVL